MNQISRLKYSVQNSSGAKITIYGKKNITSNPNPVNASSWEDVCLDCPGYEDCFDYAIEQDWHFWSCAECPRYKKPSQAPPKAPPKISETTDMPNSKAAPITSSQQKTGFWQRVTSRLIGKKKTLSIN